MNAIKGLWGSRRFLVLALDTIVSCILYFSAKYVGPSALADVKFLIAALQPVAIAIIWGYTKEDEARLNSI